MHNTPARGILVGLALLLLTACRPFWLTPPAHAPRPCVGTYVYPDSAGTCDEKGAR